MARFVYIAVMGGIPYALASHIDLGPNAYMGFARKTEGWAPTALAKNKPQHSTSMTFVPAKRDDD